MDLVGISSTAPYAMSPEQLGSGTHQRFGLSISSPREIRETFTKIQ